MGALGLAVVVALGAGSADELVSVQHKELSLKVPAAWKQRTEEGTAKFQAPSGDAEFALDVFPLETPLGARQCVDKLIAAVGGKGWERLSVGASPAARKVEVDASKERKDAFQTRTYVGCDGRTKWALTFSLKSGRAERFAKLADAIAASIGYLRAGGK